MRILLLGILTLMVVSCGGKAESQFSLKGLTLGVKDGNILYLDTNNKTIDSAVVINNAFTFETKLSSFPRQAVLRKKDNSQARMMWIEDRPMTFDASRSFFKNAIVTGSESENLFYSLMQKLETSSIEDRQKLEIEFLGTNSTSIVSAFMLSLYSISWGKEKTKELYENFSEENRNSKFGKEISKFIELNRDLKVGEQFVDFKMEDQNGKLINLSSKKGKVTLLEFWASWCGPCRKENPNLVKTYEKFNPKGFEIFAVSLDEDKGSWINAIELDNLSWIHVTELKSRGNVASLIYVVNAIPNNFLLAENGEIIGRNLRGDELSQKLEQILK